jgi:hypothetical protein
MRLLLRRNSHRTVDGAVEIASSPDTPLRERWQWHLRISPADARPADATTTVTELDRGRGAVSLVTISVDPVLVAADVSHLELGEPRRLERPEEELVVLVIGSGVALVEGRHLLNELDAMVLAGDDPLEVELERASAEPVSLAVVRLSSVDDSSVAWVP